MITRIIKYHVLDNYFVFDLGDSMSPYFSIPFLNWNVSSPEKKFIYTCTKTYTFEEDL
jgi:hypothetical protein